MKSVFCVCLLLALSASAFAAGASADYKALQGTWLPVKAQLAGQNMPEKVLKTIVLKLDKHDYVATVSGEPDKGTWTIDPSTTPRSLTITGVKGPNSGKVFPCIYAIKGDTLKVCYDLSGKKRPKDFKTAAGTELYLVTYRRNR